MKRVLFIGHEASRTGAPIILLDFLQWLKANNSLPEAKLLLMRGGDLETEYQKAIDVHVLPANDKPSLPRRGLHYLGKKVGYAPKSEKLPAFARNFDVVVGNTLISLPFLKLAKLENGSRTICWLHELEYAVNANSKEKFLELAEYIDCFLVVSKAVKEMLERFGIAAEKRLVYGFSKTEFWQVSSEESETVKKELGIPADAFVVGGSGTLEWRKGVDIFFQIARRLAASQENLYFLWVGGKLPNEFLQYHQVMHDFERLDLRGQAIITGHQKNARRFFAAMDMFALTSREDPFPLVCLEAAAMEKPIICFDKAGGAAEFIEDDCGYIVPYLDVEAFAEKILKLRQDEDTKRKFGTRAAQKVRERHNIETAAPQILEVIEKCGKQ